MEELMGVEPMHTFSQELQSCRRSNQLSYSPRKRSHSEVPIRHALFLRYPQEMRALLVLRVRELGGMYGTRTRGLYRDRVAF